jgi:hypothetical protein
MGTSCTGRSRIPEPSPAVDAELLALTLLDSAAAGTGSLHRDCLVAGRDTARRLRRVPALRRTRPVSCCRQEGFRDQSLTVGVEVRVVRQHVP